MKDKQGAEDATRKNHAPHLLAQRQVANEVGDALGERKRGVAHGHRLCRLQRARVLPRRVADVQAQVAAAAIMHQTSGGVQMPLRPRHDTTRHDTTRSAGCH